MCRLYGFRSSIRSSVHQSLIQADNALAKQSKKHKDGWGLCFYVDGCPHLIRNDQQAWADSLFRDISGVVATRAMLAHIRLATVGDVRVLNCHPFQFGRWSFAHNGELAGFSNEDVQNRVRNLIDKRFSGYVLGDTDSELIFHVFLSQLARRVGELAADGIALDDVVDALSETVYLLIKAAPDADFAEKDGNKLTMLITNGDLMIAFRYKKELFFSTHKNRCPERDSCSAFDQALCENKVEQGLIRHIIFASEPLAGGYNMWQEIAEGDYIAVRHGMVLERGHLSPKK